MMQHGSIRADVPYLELALKIQPVKVHVCEIVEVHDPAELHGERIAAVIKVSVEEIENPVADAPGSLGLVH